MCGRYQFTAEQCEEIRQIAEAIQRKYGAGAWTPGEIRPSNHAPVLLDGAGGPVPKLMKWGYQLPGTLVINARAETAAEKPLFRDSVRSRPQDFMSGTARSGSICSPCPGRAPSIWRGCMTGGGARSATAS